MFVTRVVQRDSFEPIRFALRFDCHCDVRRNRGIDCRFPQLHNRGHGLQCRCEHGLRSDFGRRDFAVFDHLVPIPSSRTHELDNTAAKALFPPPYKDCQGVIKTDLTRNSITFVSHLFGRIMSYDVSYGVISSSYAGTAPAAAELSGKVTIFLLPASSESKSECQIHLLKSRPWPGINKVELVNQLLYLSISFSFTTPWQGSAVLYVLRKAHLHYVWSSREFGHCRSYRNQCH